ncbi:MAG: ferritin family protein [Bacteroidia bacterium]|nr:ferritin family protein [Bacteroidia bacterium]
MDKFNSIDEILDFAIGEEQAAVDFYTHLAAKSKTKDMKAVFEEFALEEVKHKARLTKIKDEGVYNMPVNTVTDLKLSDYLVNVKPHDDMTYQEALIVAMKKEKSAFMLYSKLSERAPNSELKEMFRSLALEESRHKLRFEIEYDDVVLKEN